MPNYGGTMVHRQLRVNNQPAVKKEDRERPKVSLNKSAIIRRLGALESYQIALQTLDLIRSNVVSCRFVLPKRLAPTARHHDLVNEFERAVARVVLTHPHMQVGIAGAKTSTPSWVRLDSINLGKVIKWQTVKGGDDAFQKEFQQTLNREADTRFIKFRVEPGWRIMVLRSEADTSFIEILLMFNHTHLDGVSCKNFYRELLTHLHASASGLHGSPQASHNPFLIDHILTLSPTSALVASLPPPPEYILPFPVDPTAFEHFFKHEIQTPSSQYPRNVATHAHWAPIQLTSPDTVPFRSQIRTMTFPANISEELVQACRKQGATLTALLHGIALVSLAPLRELVAKADAFAFLTPMNIRRYLPSPYSKGRTGCVKNRLDAETAMGNYVTIIEHVADEELVGRVRRTLTESKYVSGCNFQPNPRAAEAEEVLSEVHDLIFVAARRVRADLTAKSESCSPRGLENDMIGFVSRGVSDWRKQLQEEVQRPRKSSWVVSNLGAVEGKPFCTLEEGQEEKEDGWSITRISMTLCANVVASAFGIAVASVKGGDLVVSVSWQEGVVDEKVGDAFVVAMEKWLRLWKVCSDCN
ncbi:alcohol acetyltransferase-domain-containing protein [Neurospora hispaniola]|uniref:Alcohol acetyltransferase-domain-containing protein n=1 Tax=Neurospora hispaniola TaxID=588809 RepID=A0AAJ0HYG3_9PEZI|nr:alcohol acetyltransferase-domain-containing protein [Neurospora hispaniola]